MVVPRDFAIAALLACLETGFVTTKRLTSVFETHLRRLIEDVLHWPADKVEITELKAGKHNRRLKLEWGGEALSVRWNGEPSHGGIQRTSEVHAQRYAAEQRVAPPLQHADERWLVHRFVNGRPLCPNDLKNERTLCKLVDAVAVLRFGPQLPDRVDPVSLVREFAATAASRVNPNTTSVCRSVTSIRSGRVSS
jgi:hypothetical protein